MDPPWPQQPHLDALETVLELPAIQLGFTPKPGYQVSPRLGQIRPRIHETLSDTVITDFGVAARTFRSLYWTVPSRALHASVSTLADLGDALMSAATADQKAGISDIAAQVHLLAGRLALFDLDNTTDAYLHFTTALEQARAGDHTNMAAAVLAHLAVASMNADNDESAWNWIRLAKVSAGTAPNARVLAWVNAVTAEVETISGNPNGGIQLLLEAEKALVAGDPQPEWLDWLTPTRMATLKATVLLSSGRARDARITLERTLAELPANDSKQRAAVCADLAAVAIAEGEDMAARDLLLRALDEVGMHGYHSALRRIAQVRGQLGGGEEFTVVDQRLASWSTILGMVS